MIFFNGCFVSNALSIQLQLLFGSGKLFRMGIYIYISKLWGRQGYRVQGSGSPVLVSLLGIIYIPTVGPYKIHTQAALLPASIKKASHDKFNLLARAHSFLTYVWRTRCNIYGCNCNCTLQVLS